MQSNTKSVLSRIILSHVKYYIFGSTYTITFNANADNTYASTGRRVVTRKLKSDRGRTQPNAE